MLMLSYHAAFDSEKQSVGRAFTSFLFLSFMAPQRRLFEG